jgi:ACT domain-containing protein
MRFRQPNNLALALHFVLNEVASGKTLSLSFLNEDEATRILEMLNEVAQERQLSVLVRPVGQRTLELTLQAPIQEPVV